MSTTGVDRCPRPPPTRWSLVARAADDETQGRLTALEELLQIYRPVLLRHLTAGMAVDVDQAQDFVQGFVADRILEKNLIGRADPARGRFRSFLLKCFTRYVRDQERKDRAQKRGPPLARVLDVDDCPATDPVAAAAYHLGWAQQVLAETLDRVEAECQGKGREDLWAILNGRVVAPALDDIPPVSYEQLVRRFHFRSPSEATNALVTAKRMFVRCLREVIGDTVAGEDEVDAEIRDLKRILSGLHAGSGPAWRSKGQEAC